MAILKAATEEQQRRLFARLSFEDALKLDADFEMWARKNQLPPEGEGWRTWLMMAGRGFGKTRAGAEKRHVNFPNGFGFASLKYFPGAAAPASGTYRQGDVIWNTAPSAGGNMGWVCVAAGSPGTWKSFGAIAA